MKINFNKEKCIACGACAVACMDMHDIEIQKGQKPYRSVSCSETGGKRYYLSSSCMHCDEPLCRNACPRNCIRKDPETGFVVFDNKGCTGCGLCAKTCHFHAISFRRVDGQQKMEKCDGCIGRIKAGLQPVCVQNCPMGALTLVP